MPEKKKRKSETYISRILTFLYPSALLKSKLSNIQTTITRYDGRRDFIYNIYENYKLKRKWTLSKENFQTPLEGTKKHLNKWKDVMFLEKKTQHR